MKNWERKTPLQNIAFIAMMASVNGALSLLISFLPYSSILAVIALPIINALGVYLVNKKWLIVYIVSVIALPLITTIFDISTTLFYVIPSIVSGFIYGTLSKTGVPTCLRILSSAAWVLISTYLSLPIIKLVYSIDMIPVVVSTLKLPPFANTLMPSFLFAFSWASTSISHFLIMFVYEKIGLESDSLKWEIYAYPLISIALGFLSIGLSFISLEISYVILSLSIYFAAFSLQNFLENNKKWVFLILITLVVASIFIFASTYALMPPHAGGALISIFVIAVSISSFIASFKAKPLAN